MIMKEPEFMRDLGKMPWGTSQKVHHIWLVRCPTCLKPYAVLRSNIMGKKSHGCRACGTVKAYAKENACRVAKAKSTFVEKAIKVHGDCYDYDRVDYVTARIHVLIGCRKHGFWSTTPDNHLRGTGCPICGASHLNKTPEGPQYFYYIYFTALKLWKVGITSKGATERFRSEPEPFEILMENYYVDGVKAWELEQRVIALGPNYKGKKVLKSGNTELFTEPVLDLIIKQKETYASKM